MRMGRDSPGVMGLHVEIRLHFTSVIIVQSISQSINHEFNKRLINRNQIIKIIHDGKKCKTVNVIEHQRIALHTNIIRRHG